MVFDGKARCWEERGSRRKGRHLALPADRRLGSAGRARRWRTDAAFWAALWEALEPAVGDLVCKQSVRRGHGNGAGIVRPAKGVMGDCSPRRGFPNVGARVGV
jgi:hypothetical protein